MFVVATHSRQGAETLFLVDRTKQRRSFWSNRTVDALVFPEKADAEAKARTLKFNNPRVIPWETAHRLATAVAKTAKLRAQERERWAILGEIGEGWDGHKDAF